MYILIAYISYIVVLLTSCALIEYTRTVKPVKLTNT